MNKNFSMKIYEDRIMALAFIPMTIGMFIYKIYHPDPDYIGPLNDGNIFGILICGFLYFIFDAFKCKYTGVISLNESAICYTTKKNKYEIKIENIKYCVKIPIYMVFFHNDKISKAYNVLEGNLELLFRIIILFTLFPILPFCYFFHCLIYKTINFNYFLVCDNDLKAILLPCVKANKNIINKYFNKKINTIYLNSKLKEISLKGENNE